MGKDMTAGSSGNLFRDIPYTPLQERFKIGKDGVELRVDIIGVGPKAIGGHLTAIKL
jgi:hypothetical protein